MPKTAPGALYNENFCSSTPDSEDKFEWMVRIYSYSAKPGLVTTLRGKSGSVTEARADAKQAAAEYIKKNEVPQ